MSIAAAAADRMVAYVQAAGAALQIEVVDHLEEAFGPAAVYVDEMSGNRRIRPAVHDSFRLKARAAGIRWNRHILGWELDER